MYQLNIKKTDTYITCLAGFIIFVCCILIIKDFVSYKTAQREYEGINSLIDLPVETKDHKEETQYSSKVSNNEATRSDIEKLYDINPDFAGILSIPSLGLTYPVVQGTDNEKYLHYTFEGRKNPAGCLFMDHKNNRSFTDDNTVVYGHNMKDGSMFGSLKRFIKEDFDNSDVKAYIITRSGTTAYLLKKAEVVNIDSYKAPENLHDALTLYTCWSNDKSRRLLVTFIKEKT